MADLLPDFRFDLNYSNGNQEIKQISPYLFCFIIFIICIIIHIPSDLAQTYTPDDQLFVKLSLCYSPTFSNTPIAKMILLISFIIEGPIVMILAIGSNIFAYISYRSFIKRKQESLSNHRNIRLTEKEKRKLAKNEKKNQKLLMMTIYLSVFSIISHIVQFGAQSIVFAINSKTSPSLYILARFIFLFTIIFKHFFTFFFFYHFNTKFKYNFLSILRIKKSQINNDIQLTTRQNLSHHI